MAEKRFQVFVSSTYNDLKSERDRVLRTLAECNYIAAGMEFFPAIDEEQFNFIKTVIDESDYYVAIVAGKYGTVAPEGLSYSEKEYDYAVQKSIPVIALIRENINLLDSTKKETATETLEVLERFRQRLSTGRLVSYWKDETELCYRLINSLATTTKKYPGQGWVRGGKETPEELLRKIVLLEEENRTLQRNIFEQQQIPLAARITDQLKNEMDIKYIYKINSEDNMREGIISLSGLKIAHFVIPRLREQVGEEKFASLISELIFEITGNSVSRIESDATKAILSMLDTLSVVNKTFRGSYRDTVYIIRTALGEQVVGDEVLKAFTHEQLQKQPSERNVTLLRVLEDIALLLSRSLTYLSTNVAEWIRKWLGPQ